MLFFLSVRVCALYIIYIYAQGGTPVSRLSICKDMKKRVEGVGKVLFVIKNSSFFLFVNA